MSWNNKRLCDATAQNRHMYMHNVQMHMYVLLYLVVTTCLTCSFYPEGNQKSQKRTNQLTLWICAPCPTDCCYTYLFPKFT